MPSIQAQPVNPARSADDGPEHAAAVSLVPVHPAHQEPE